MKARNVMRRILKIQNSVKIGRVGTDLNGGLESVRIGKCQNPIFAHFWRNWHFPILTLSNSDTFPFWHFPILKKNAFWHFPILILSSLSFKRTQIKVVCDIQTLCKPLTANWWNCSCVWKCKIGLASSLFFIRIFYKITARIVETENRVDFCFFCLYLLFFIQYFVLSFIQLYIVCVYYIQVLHLIHTL